MNHFNVTPLRTTFQVQTELRDRMDEIARAAFERGQESGRHLAKRQARYGEGAAFCIGVGCGVVFLYTIIGWLQP